MQETPLTFRRPLIRLFYPFDLCLPGGEIITLSAVIDSQAGRGPPEINRIHGQRHTTVTVNLAEGTPLGDPAAAIRRRVSAIGLHLGFSFLFGGEDVEQ